MSETPPTLDYSPPTRTKRPLWPAFLIAWVIIACVGAVILLVVLTLLFQRPFLDNLP